MPADLPKYALLEIERRLRVDASRLPPLHTFPSWLVTDRYLNGGRLRLRKMVSSDGGTRYKFCKKYERAEAYSEPITNLYLTESEYDSLAALPAREITKRRYRFPFAGRVFGLDEFCGPHAGLYLCEIEAASQAELAAIVFPPFCTDDVTHDPAYSGAALAADTIASGARR